MRSSKRTLEPRVQTRVAAWSLQRIAALSWYHTLFAVGTLFAWAHTLDEFRIGQFVALPFALANTIAVFGWTRCPRGWRAALCIGFGLVWIVTVIPYHVLPLMQGIVTSQNLSGLTRIAGGLIMVGTGATLVWRSWRGRQA